MNHEVADRIEPFAPPVSEILARAAQYPLEAPMVYVESQERLEEGKPLGWFSRLWNRFTG